MGLLSVQANRCSRPSFLKTTKKEKKKESHRSQLLHPDVGDSITVSSNVETTTKIVFKRNRNVKSVDYAHEGSMMEESFIHSRSGCGNPTRKIRKS